jgi:caa(3)-type oxidase subunit IV
LNTPIALVIAAGKAVLVALFFMHLKDAPDSSGWRR